MICSNCTDAKHVKRDNEKMFPKNANYFCSDACMLAHVVNTPRLSGKELRDFGIRSAPRDINGCDCFSLLLGVAFRSWFEVVVAEHLVLNWKLQVFYEPHALVLDRTHVYIPDFWIPKYGVWLEVKGEWRVGSKSKFERATEILGKDRLLLIPPLYRNRYSKKGARIC